MLIQHEADFDRAVKNFIDLRTDFLAPAHTLVDSYTSSTASADERLNALKARKRIKAAVEQGVPLVPYSDSDSLVDTQQRTAKEARLAKLLENDAIAGIITDDIRQAVEVKNNL